MNIEDDDARYSRETTVPSWLREMAKADPVKPPWVPQLGDVIGGQYEIREKLGEGGVGIVYRAWQKGVERPVAIKMMNVAGKEDLFEREAKATAQVKHDNAITIYQIGRENGTPTLLLNCSKGTLSVHD